MSRITAVAQIRLFTLMAAGLAELTGGCDEPVDAALDNAAVINNADADPAVVDADDNDDDLAAAPETSPRGHALARVWLHGFRRHLAGFPGGASEVEQALTDALADQDLTDEDLRGFVARVEATLAEDLVEEEDALPLSQPLTRASLEPHLSPALEFAAPTPEQHADDCSKPFNTIGKYRFKIEGVQSVACSWDNSEPACAFEEVFVTWTLFPSGLAPTSGITNLKTGLNAGAASKFDSGHAAPSTGTISTDALLVFRPFEQDSNYRTTYALTDAKAASAAVKAQIDWAYVKSHGRMQTDPSALYEVLSRASVGADDFFALQQLGVSEQTMWQSTHGCYKYLGNFPFVVPVGDYAEYAMRIFTASAHWKLWVTINRS